MVQFIFVGKNIKGTSGQLSGRSSVLFHLCMKKQFWASCKEKQWSLFLLFLLEHKVEHLIDYTILVCFLTSLSVLQHLNCPQGINKVLS